MLLVFKPGSPDLDTWPLRLANPSWTEEQWHQGLVRAADRLLLQQAVDRHIWPPKHAYLPSSPSWWRGFSRCTQAPVGEDWRREISKPTCPLRTPPMPMNTKSSVLKRFLPQGHKEGFLGVLAMSLCLTWVLVTACLPHNNSLSYILFWMCVIIHD